MAAPSMVSYRTHLSSTTLRLQAKQQESSGVECAGPSLSDAMIQDRPSMNSHADMEAAILSLALL